MKLDTEYGTYQTARKVGGESWRAWEHKDPSDCYWSVQRSKLKGVFGLLGFLGGGAGSIEAVECLDKLADVPAPVELGLVAAGTAFATYMLAKAGEAIVDHQRSLYQP